MNTVHLVDASIYVFRSYYSVSPEFFDHEEQPVHAVYGFLNTLLGLVDEARAPRTGLTQAGDNAAFALPHRAC